MKTFSFYGWGYAYVLVLIRYSTLIMSVENNKDFKDVASKWMEGKASHAEQEAFNEWYAAEEYGAIEKENESDPAFLRTKASILAGIIAKIKEEKGSVIKLWTVLRYTVSASAILLLFFGFHLFKSTSLDPKMMAAPNIVHKKDVGPGQNMAVLTLEDQTRIVLDSSGKQLLNETAGGKAIKVVGGLLDYFSADATHQESTSTLNTLSTPRGAQYQVVLSDGTKVFLNAASSIKYQTVFKGNKREVELSGEAFFEVVKDGNRPFVVHTYKGDVNVLGTEFNVSAYAKEGEMKTTLMEGSVKISHRGKSFLMKPGQQVMVDKEIKLTEVDVNEVLAWKNGLFYFNHTPLNVVLQQLERWYDIDIDFNTVPLKHFNGSISRKSNLSQVLQMLEITSDIKFEINGKSVKIKN